MVTKEGIDELRGRLTAVRTQANAYFNSCLTVQETGEGYVNIWDDLLTDELRANSEVLRTDVKRLSVDIAGAARGSPLIAEADLQDLRHNTRGMLASLHFNEYHYRGVYVHHDEGTVLGVDPPSQFEESLDNVRQAVRNFEAAAANVSDLLDLLLPTTTMARPAGTASYRPNTAFVMMPIDKTQPELEDVKQGIKDVCKEFGITAVTADEIEHDGAITERVLEEIQTSEFLIADLTGERPNVYYEIGHAHARDKRVILYRKTGTKIHFDIAHRNCPDYTNVTNLKDQLRKRLEITTNKPVKK